MWGSNNLFFFLSIPRSKYLRAFHSYFCKLHRPRSKSSTVFRQGDYDLAEACGKVQQYSHIQQVLAPVGPLVQSGPAPSQREEFLCDRKKHLVHPFGGLFPPWSCLKIWPLGEMFWLAKLFPINDSRHFRKSQLCWEHAVTVWKFLCSLRSVLASDVVHGNVTKEKEWRCRLNRDVSPEIAKDKILKSVFGSWRQFGLWRKAWEQALVWTILPCFSSSPSLGFIPVAQKRQGKEQLPALGQSRSAHGGKLCDTQIQAQGSPFLKVGTKAWSSAPTSGEQPVWLQVTLKSTQWETTSHSSPFFPPTLPGQAAEMLTKSPCVQQD